MFFARGPLVFEFAVKSFGGGERSMAMGIDLEVVGLVNLDPCAGSRQVDLVGVLYRMKT